MQVGDYVTAGRAQVHLRAFAIAFRALQVHATICSHSRAAEGRSDPDRPSSPLAGGNKGRERECCLSRNTHRGAGPLNPFPPVAERQDRSAAGALPVRRRRTGRAPAAPRHQRRTGSGAEIPVVNWRLPALTGLTCWVVQAARLALGSAAAKIFHMSFMVSRLMRHADPDFFRGGGRVTSADRVRCNSRNQTGFGGRSGAAGLRPASRSWSMIVRAWPVSVEVCQPSTFGSGATAAAQAHAEPRVSTRRHSGA